MHGISSALRITVGCNHRSMVQCDSIYTDVVKIVVLVCVSHRTSSRGYSRPNSCVVALQLCDCRQQTMVSSKRRCWYWMLSEGDIVVCVSVWGLCTWMQPQSPPPPPTHTQPKVKKQRQAASKVLHPHSRKASQLRKKTHRMERVELWVV